MLTGSVPFTDPVPMNILQMQMQSPVPPLPPRVPAAVQRVVMRALEKDPSRRHASAAVMMEEAQAVLTSLQSGAFARQSGQGPAAHGTPDAFPSVPDAFPPVPPAPDGARTILAGSDRAGPAIGAGPPPPVRMHPPRVEPAMAADGAANMPTVLDRPSPLYDGGRGAGPPVAAAAASARTILVNTSGQLGRGGGPQGGPAGPGAHPPYPPGPGMPPDQRTVMLANSEGIVSMAPDGRPMPARSDSRGGPAAYPARRPGASALFWILCLLTGLAVGVGAYWLVLELGR
jgi:serine/threonine-protein kinase